MNSLADILAMLRSHTGHDFSHYKETTILRRIERRIQVTQKSSPDQYVELLRESPDEIGRLFSDMLIGVTQFMRDDEVFEALESKVVPELCAHKSAGENVRVWVPGCASGEEAYSLAILFLREIGRGDHDLSPQVFATDIDSKALDAARAAIYPESITAHLTGEQLEHYFRKHGHGYRVVKRVREACIFSKHDLIRDPPFSRLDMISCRNVLIYMTPTLQQRLIPIFHYALRPGGVLLLGPSETVTRFEHLFEPIDHKQRLFRRRDLSVAPRFDFPLGSYGDSTNARETGSEERQRNRENSVSRQAERYLLEQYAPSCVVVDSRYEAVYFAGNTGQYLQPPSGAPDNAVLNMARHGLKNQLRQALDDAARTQQPVVREDVHVRTNGEYEIIRLRVRPIPRLEQRADYYAVIFESGDPRGGEVPRAKPPEPPAVEQEQSLVQQLESELESTRRHLRDTTEDMESSNEALKSANEELMSTNEELQSAAEELDTSKEELQSVNEELSFANEELRRNNDHLSRANSDIKNLFDNTQIAMMFLDKDLHIRSLTPRMSDLYNLRASDTGRSITDIRARHDYTDLETDFKRVLDTLEPVERSVHTADGEYVLRILPYQTLDGHIDGVVMTFIDITSLTRARADIEALTEARARRAGELEAMLSVLPVGVLICADAKSGQVRTNRMGAEILGVTEGAEISGRGRPPPFKLLRDDSTVASAEFSLQRVLETGEPLRHEGLRVQRADGAVRDIELSAWPVKDEKGALCGVVGVFTDVTERKRQIDLWKAQQSALSRLALFAFGESDIAAVLRQVVTCLCEVLEGARCEVWRLHAERNELVLAATSTDVAIDTKTQAVPAYAGNLFGYTLTSELLVVIEDATAETRFAYPSHLRREGMVRGLSVAVKADGGLWGVLCVHDHRRRKFLVYDTNFLQSVADLAVCCDEKHWRSVTGKLNAGRRWPRPRIGCARPNDWRRWGPWRPASRTRSTTR
ncbi:MAG: CheR family methyltransferase [Gammaproteobacteria bacterium]